MRDHNPRVVLVARLVLTALAVLGLAYDAYVHFDLASNYDAVKSSVLSKGELFRIEGVVAILSALAIMVRPRRYTALIAFLVAASALAVVLIYRYIDVKAFGPIPSMYEPVWEPTEKIFSAYAEALATVSALGLLAVLHFQHRDSSAGAVADATTG